MNILHLECHEETLNKTYVKLLLHIQKDYLGDIILKNLQRCSDVNKNFDCDYYKPTLLTKIKNFFKGVKWKEK